MIFDGLCTFRPFLCPSREDFPHLESDSSGEELPADGKERGREPKELRKKLKFAATHGFKLFGHA